MILLLCRRYVPAKILVLIVHLFEKGGRVKVFPWYIIRQVLPRVCCTRYVTQYTCRHDDLLVVIVIKWIYLYQCRLDITWTTIRVRYSPILTRNRLWVLTPNQSSYRWYVYRIKEATAAVRVSSININSNSTCTYDRLFLWATGVAWGRNKKEVSRGCFHRVFCFLFFQPSAPRLVSSSLMSLDAQ